MKKFTSKKLTAYVMAALMAGSAMLGTSFGASTAEAAVKVSPIAGSSEDFIKERLPEIPAQYRILCVIGIGYADYTPKPLPEYEGPERLLYVK